MPDFNGTVGAVEIGVMISNFLFGLATVQTFSYYKKFPKDPWQMKSFVGVLWILELAHSMLTSHTIYWTTVIEYGNTKALNLIPGSLIGAVVLSGIIGPAIQAFFAHRVRRLSHKWIIPVVCWFLCVIRSISLIAVAVTSYYSPTLKFFKETYQWLLATSLAVSTAVDVLIAASLCYYLWHQRDTKFARTRRVVDQLIKWSIQTGLLTSIATVVMLILFVAVANHAWLSMFCVISKLFSNSLMASLNARAKLRNFDDKVGVERSSTAPGRSLNVTVEMSRVVLWADDDDLEATKRGGFNGTTTH
jgi:hypothetical protein